MRCENCGHKNVAANKFCEMCGQPLAEKKAKKSTGKSKLKRVLFAVVLIFFISLAIWVASTFPLQPKKEIIGHWGCWPDAVSNSGNSKYCKNDNLYIRFDDDGFIFIKYQGKEYSGRYNFINRDTIEIEKTNSYFDDVFDIGFFTNNDFYLLRKGEYQGILFYRKNPKFNFSHFLECFGGNSGNNFCNLYNSR